MKKHELSQRLKRLPPYLFAEIDRQKSILKAKGIKFIDVSIGDPDIEAPKSVIDILHRSAKIKLNQKYALDQGKLGFRKSIKAWSKKRFGINVNENTEILPLIGSKEGLVHFPLAFINRGDLVIIPSPGYPGYRGAGIFSDAKLYELALRERNNFLPDLSKIPRSVRNKAKLIYLNYPNNPTTALAPSGFLRDLVRFCSKYGIILVYDNAYSEIYFKERPKSVLEIKGAKEIAIEFHSLSKAFCMTGFRVGWACGNEQLIKGLLKVKANVDSGIFGAVQEAATVALSKEGKYVKKLRATINERRDIFVNGLLSKGFKGVYAQSTFYVWVKVPKPFKSSIAFAQHLLNDKKIVATPGIGFGKYGEGFIRFALTVDKKILKKTIDLL